MDYQILVLDLDGTLTNSKKEITQPTLEALIEKKICPRQRPPDTGRYAAGRTASSGRLRKLYPFF